MKICESESHAKNVRSVQINMSYFGKPGRMSGRYLFVHSASVLLHNCFYRQHVPHAPLPLVGNCDNDADAGAAHF